MWGTSPHSPAQTASHTQCRGERMRSQEEQVHRRLTRAHKRITLTHFSNHESELSLAIPRACGKEAIVVAASAELADAQLSNSRRGRFAGELRTEIERPPLRGRFSGYREIHVLADFITLPTYRRAKMNAQFACRCLQGCQRRDCAVKNSRCDSPPSRMQQRDKPGAVRDVYGDTIGDRHADRGSRRWRNMSIA